MSQVIGSIVLPSQQTVVREQQFLQTAQGDCFAITKELIICPVCYSVHLADQWLEIRKESVGPLKKAEILSVTKRLCPACQIFIKQARGRIIGCGNADMCGRYIFTPTNGPEPIGEWKYHNRVFGHIIFGNMLCPSCKGISQAQVFINYLYKRQTHQLTK